MTGKPRFLAIPLLVAVLATLSWGAQLARVEDFRVEGVADGIRLAWKSGRTKEIAGYRIYRIPSAELKTGKAPAVLVEVAPSVEEYVDRAIDPNVVYAYLIAALDGKGTEGARTVPVLGRVRDTVPPAPPGNLAAKALDNGVIRLSWAAPSDRDLAVYRVYRSVKGIRSDVLLPPVKAAGPSGKFEDRVDPKSPFPYIYRVAAVDISGNEGEAAGPVEVAVPDRRPPGPPVLTGLSVSDNGIRVEWAPPPDADVAGFRVYRRIRDGGAKAGRLNSDLIPAVQGFLLDNTVRGGVHYAYTVTAVDNSGNESKPSREGTQRALWKVDSPTPSGLAVKAGKEGHPLVTWRPVESGEVRGYLVYSSSAADNGYRQASGLVKEPPFEDAEAEPGRALWYRVRAFYRNGQVSEFSEPAVWKPAGDGMQGRKSPPPSQGDPAK